ncbi:succinylglutamate desuccinylase/aspartoacylase family protein [Natronococcus jeotgali]|uniref:Succinylglutamate desuccinylase/aspartoacylase n=1 Tax=Natronococcus jeotgali DSM 18795 TaxID=1227498 RepID=L9XAY7_9EURY|nr:succinylglutamate desuccinylase/aspartoacylase family protein [Natronococcus jeotgali]ELY58576.1 Succinylglutamate desuccinylase/aspartoacylase [Natronococcus jeotgali DSM 18795]
MEHESVSHSVAERALARLPSGSEVSVTVHRYEGGAGPTAYLQAAQHGIELNGAAALRRLHDSLLEAELAGTVVAVPVVNSLAFDHDSYVTPQAVDAVNPNFNRVWPGDGDGTLQERAVASLWELIATADVVVDLHSGTADMLEHVRFQGGERDSRRLASVFGADYLMTDPGPERPLEEYTGTLRAAARLAGTTAIVPELSNSRQVDLEAARRGADGIRNVLGELGMLRAEPPDPPSQTVLYDDGGRVGADRSGLFEPAPGVAVGDRVAEGDELGTVYSPDTFERRQSVAATASGVIYSLTRESAVTAGEKLAGIAGLE